MNIPSNTYVLSVIAVGALATYLTRALPFLFLQRYRENKLLVRFEREFPAGMMVLLIAYCMKDGFLKTPLTNMNELAGVIAAIGTHFWKRNTLLSIGVGIAIFLTLRNFGS